MSKKKRHTKISGRDAELAFLALLEHCDEGAQLRQRMAMEQVKIQSFVHRRAGMSSDERQRAKELVVEIVEREDKTAPLTDDQISDMLFEQNLGVTSWTARKLRLELGIPNSAARNERIRKNEAMRVIAALVDAEDKKEPASDDALRAKLLETGISVARRTVAKYRRAMGIPSSHQRREHPDLAHILELVKCIVEEEDKKKPASDDALGAKLMETGIPVVRRTVAKYRRAMGIPSSHQRRESPDSAHIRELVKCIVEEEDRCDPLTSPQIAALVKSEGYRCTWTQVKRVLIELGIPAPFYRKRG